MLQLASPSQRAAEEHIPPAAMEVIDEYQAPLGVTVDSVPRGQIFHSEPLWRLPQEFIQRCHRHSFSLHFLNHHGDTFLSSALCPAEFPNDHFRTAGQPDRCCYVILIVQLPVIFYKIKLLELLKKINQQKSKIF